MRTRVSLPVAIAIALPLLLAVTVAAIAVAARVQGVGAPPPPDTGPLAVAPVDSPAAGGPECQSLLAALPAELDGPDGPMPPRPIAEAEQLPGVRAWAAAPRPVVLRCGLPRPVELTPTSALLEVNGVRWLQIDDGLPEPVQVSYIAVDRPVYVALTTPVDAGSGPLQQVSEVVRATLPATAVAVR
ncbi:DUF3515 domain-containing protein [Pseudonocardia kunmingensis]|uniref:Uncharacterized protein DUF3515 n=1 Tax=Pseudonocardia kunmingensis TaxID=630975 RepID=A0A543DZ63_9PSEU|nr:DUF3515 domain-containing protein [Pseudonocardia kunmingensis]TQM14625.1 uncharacterized protein DUF3515 [Pseudonocardia kunmingensis]